MARYFFIGIMISKNVSNMRRDTGNPSNKSNNQEAKSLEISILILSNNLYIIAYIFTHIYIRAHRFVLIISPQSRQ